MSRKIFGTIFQNFVTNFICTWYCSKTAYVGGIPPTRSHLSWSVYRKQPQTPLLS